MTALYAAPCVVRFQDIDAAGVAFFAWIFEYFHDAYVGLLASRGLPLHEALAQRRWAAPLAHAEADFSRPLRFGGDYTIEITAVQLGETSMTVSYVIRGASGATHASGKTVHVFVDLATMKPQAIPADVRAALS
jgi:YbgC/YbaW family acyl-CoA thioester hydrolase